MSIIEVGIGLDDCVYEEEGEYCKSIWCRFRQLLVVKFLFKFDDLVWKIGRNVVGIIDEV